ncbi:MAG: radical SAM protein [Veillonellales bacterium]
MEHSVEPGAGAEKRQMVFYAPGSRHYDNGLYTNTPRSFVNISVTGTKCQCRCAHCNGSLLSGMLSAAEPELLLAQAQKLAAEGCKGILVSGGACRDGSVPLKRFGAALKQIGSLGLKVVVHPGLLTPELADILADAGVDRVALDLIGDAATIRQVYHLDKTPADYRRSLQAARNAGLKTSPHIVIGLHYGEIRGEYAALDMVAAEGADSLVLVILKSLPGTDMAQCPPPDLAKVAAVFQAAREKLSSLPIALGCARPAGEYARTAERYAVDAGFAAIAYPARETVDYVLSRGYSVAYREVCCGILTDF